MAFKMKVVFTKQGAMRFISHLDLMRLLQRACRRADLPVTLTQGFSPHVKLSISRAMKLGAESAGEEATFYLDRPLKPDEFTRSLNAQLPEGVQVVRAELG